MAMPETATDALEARLQAAPSGGGAWIRAARAAAEGRLRAMGLPGRRDEYWKYTDPTSLISPEVAPAEALTADEAPVFDGIERLRVVFVDGRLDAAASDPLALEYLEIEPLSQVAEVDIHWAAEVFGQLEARGQDPVARPLAALNTALATEGLVIRAKGVVPRPVSLVYVHERPSSDAMIHHVVRVEPGAELTLLENGPAAARFNKVLEVDVADGGRFHHVRAQGRDHDRQAVTHVFARLGAEALFKSFTLTVNGALTRNEAVVELLGDDAVAHVAGAAAGDGAEHPFHQDDTVFVTHAAERCESRQVFKKVLRNGAVGVFQGKILVRPGAQKTDGYQISQALLLDEDAEFYAKPELEIYADDVKCSHGSTSGGLDPDALFYLRSRGVPEAEAQNMLVLSFLAEALAEIEDPRLREDLEARLEAWLRRRTR